MHVMMHPYRIKTQFKQVSARWSAQLKKVHALLDPWIHGSMSAN
jgi:hypothetical protein